MPKINLSFKHNDEEIRLFTRLNSLPDKSLYIKKAINFYENYKNFEPIWKEILKNLTIKEKVCFIEKALNVYIKYESLIPILEQLTNELDKKYAKK